MRVLLVLLFVVNLLSLPLSAKEKYVQRLINDEGSVYIDLNNNGDIAFIGLDNKSNPQVYVYSNGKTILKTESPSNTYSYYNLSINDKGDLVWISYEKQKDNNYKYFIKALINNSLKTIHEFTYSNPNSVPYPVINNKGNIAWCYPTAYGLQPDIFLYENGSVVNITNNQNGKGGVAISDGYLVWYSDKRLSSDWNNYIQMYNIATKAISTISSAKSSYPVIDKYNDVVYLIDNGNVNSLMMFQNGTTKHIGDSVYSPSDYDINNNQVVWADKNQRIRFWSNGISSYISPLWQKCNSPRVNSKGDISWKDDKSNVWILSNGTLYNASEKYGDCPYHLLLNEMGIVAWRGDDLDYYGAPIYASYFLNVGELHGEILELTPSITSDEISSLKGLKGVLVTDGINSCLSDSLGKFILSDIEFGQVKISFKKEFFKFTPPEIELNFNKDKLTLDYDIIAEPLTGINDYHPNQKLNISPNPASDYIEINLDNVILSEAKSPVKIYNTFGECVITQFIHPMSSRHRMNIELLPIGLYFIHIGNYSEKFVVVR